MTSRRRPPAEGMLLGRILPSTQGAPLGFRMPVKAAAEPELLRAGGEWHAMTVARTGAGKGVSCLVPALLQYRGTTIVIDPKGENAAVTARFRRGLGHVVHVVDPTGISGQPASGLNPLDVIDVGASDFSDQVRALAQATMPPVFADRDVFWRNRAMHFISLCICHVLDTMPAGRRNLFAVRDTLYELLREIAARNDVVPGAVASWLRTNTNPEIARLRSLLGAGAPETASGMLLTATEGVDFLRGEALESSFCSSDVDFDAVTRGDPVTIYLVLPPHMLESHAAVMRLWLTSLFQAILRRRNRPARNTLLLLDEAAQLGTFAPLQQAVTLLRGYGVSTWSFWQDVSQLRQRYPQDWRTMTNNCSMLQCFGATSAAGARDLAEFLGLTNPLLVEGLGPEEMVVQIAGRPPVVAQRLDYLRDAMFAGRFDPNPFYATGRRRQVRRRPSKPVARQLSLPQIAQSLGALWSRPRRSLP